jgi:hypothetical protein
MSRRAWTVAARESLASWLLGNRTHGAAARRVAFATLKSIARWYADLWHKLRHAEAGCQHEWHPLLFQEGAQVVRALVCRRCPATREQP